MLLEPKMCSVIECECLWTPKCVVLLSSNAFGTWNASSYGVRMPGWQAVAEDWQRALPCWNRKLYEVSRVVVGVLTVGKARKRFPRWEHIAFKIHVRTYTYIDLADLSCLYERDFSRSFLPYSSAGVFVENNCNYTSFFCLQEIAARVRTALLLPLHKQW